MSFDVRFTLTGPAIVIASLTAELHDTAAGAEVFLENNSGAACGHGF